MSNSERSLELFLVDLLDVIKNNFDISEAIESEVYKYKSVINYFNALELNKRNS